MTIHTRLLSRQNHTQDTTAAFPGTTDSFDNASKLLDACSSDWRNHSCLLSQFAAFLSTLLPTKCSAVAVSWVGLSHWSTPSQVPSLPPGPALSSQFALSSLGPYCPAHLSFSCTGSFVELSTCSAHQLHTDMVHCLCSTPVFPDRLTSPFWTAAHYTVLCCVLHCSVQFVSSSFSVQPRGLFTTHQTLLWIGNLLLPLAFICCTRPLVIGRSKSWKYRGGYEFSQCPMTWGDVFSRFYLAPRCASLKGSPWTLNSTELCSALMLLMQLWSRPARPPLLITWCSECSTCSQKKTKLSRKLEHE